MSPRIYEEEPSVSDYRRSVAGYDSDRNSDSDREISLGTPTILGLFVALAIVCACFFGLGYALGHRTTSDEPAIYAGTTAVGNGASKPAAGSTTPAPQSQSIDNTAALSADASASASQTSASQTAASQTAASQTAASQTAASQTAAQTATVPLTSAPALNPPAAEPSASPARSSSPAQPAPAAAPAGAFVVQVAAVSSQDVADILVNSLQKKGYAVAVHQVPQDKLLHVQIGPFADRAAADAMRQRVLADGFNAIVK